MRPMMSFTAKQPWLYACHLISPSELETYLILRHCINISNNGRWDNTKATSGQKWENGHSLPEWLAGRLQSE